MDEARVDVLALLREGVTWSRLTEAQRVRAGEALRDVYLGVRRGDAALARWGELAREVVGRVEVVPEDAVGHLSCVWHPTRTHRMLRFVERGALPFGGRGRYAEAPEAPGFAAAFVDPEALCYRTFENILPLDRLIAPQLKRRQLELDAPQVRRADDAEVLSFTMRGPAITEALLRLDGLGLYVEPLNAGSRGGRRFIFHAATLAERLTEALLPVLPEAMRDGFVHVNPVFRCNRFEPGDPPFAAHHDSPYYDGRLHHSSRYTVLLYLTGGDSAPEAPALRVGDVALETIEAMTCVIFHQRHQHEGNPFIKNTKVFLRAELIYQHDPAEHVHDPRLGALFSQACYLSGECLFEPELSAYTHDAYDRVAEAHWTGALGPTPSDKPLPLLRKRYQGLSFVTTGYDYWARCEDVSLEGLATLAILDHFNAQIGGGAFRSSCNKKLITPPADGPPTTAWIADYLSRRPREGDPVISELPKHLLIPEAERASAHDEFPRVMSEYDRWENHGPMHRNREVIEVYNTQREQALADLLPAPILIMGQEVFLDRSRFIIEGDRVHVLSHEPLRPLHFAAMYTYHNEPHELVQTEATLQTPYLLLPPMLFKQSEGCWHLMLDLFQNTWMVQTKRGEVKIPSVMKGLW